MMTKHVQEMSEAELDAHINMLHERLNQEVLHHRLLLQQLEAIRERRQQFTVAHDRQEIERIQKALEGL